MNIKPILIATAVALTSINAYAGNCRVTYKCGDGATGTAPSYRNISDPSGAFVPSGPGECAREGHMFVYWVVTQTGSKLDPMSESALHPGTEYNLTARADGKTCANLNPSTGGLELTAQWVAQPTITATDIITPTSRAYTDSKMNSKQPAFSGLGANKLMTYGTTDGAVGSRDIVTTLGDSTTATTVPTIGAINGGFNTKQYKLNGNAGWVATNTGINGLVGQKPIYDATNNYNTALVDAQTLNNAVINAVNSELIRVDETGEPNANGTLWKLNDLEHLTLLNTRDSINVASLNTSTTGTSYCHRSLSGTDDYNGTCSAATLSALGATNSKSGMWGVVFDYGDIVGKSVCSSQIGEYANAATAKQNTALNTEFITQTGNGNLANDQKNCWCKMDSLNGEGFAVSRWVFYDYPYSSASDCAGSCASDCGYYVRDDPDFRVGVFGAVAQ